MGGAKCFVPISVFREKNKRIVSRNNLMSTAHKSYLYCSRFVIYYYYYQGYHHY
jgi:hypothetical protein